MIRSNIESHPDMNRKHIDALNELSRAAYDNATAKGFHDKDSQTSVVDNYKGWVANLHSEVSELWEAAKTDKLWKPCDKAGDGCFLTCEEEELADIIIRVLDTAGARGINIGRAVLLKMAYNATRPHMHGKLA